MIQYLWMLDEDMMRSAYYAPVGGIIIEMIAIYVMQKNVLARSAVEACVGL